MNDSDTTCSFSDTSTGPCGQVIVERMALTPHAVSLTRLQGRHLKAVGGRCYCSVHLKSQKSIMTSEFGLVKTKSNNNNNNNNKRKKEEEDPPGPSLSQGNATMCLGPMRSRTNPN